MESLEDIKTTVGKASRHARIIAHAELFDSSKQAYSHTAVVYQIGNILYHGRIGRYLIDGESANIDISLLSNVVVIPNIKFPEYDEALFGTGFAAPPAGSFTKRLCLMNFSESHCDFIAKEMTAEARVYQALRNNPHDHATVSIGCLVCTGRVVGFCLEKYEMTLHERMESKTKPEKVNREQWYGDLLAAVAHIHSLGLCHNDINPRNIMFRADGAVVLIDYDSCQPDGEKLRKIGTIGWFKEGTSHSSKANDEYGMAKLKQYLSLTK